MDASGRSSLLSYPSLQLYTALHFSTNGPLHASKEPTFSLLLRLTKGVLRLLTLLYTSPLRVPNTTPHCLISTFCLPPPSPSFFSLTIPPPPYYHSHTLFTLKLSYLHSPTLRIGLVPRDTSCVLCDPDVLRLCHLTIPSVRLELALTPVCKLSFLYLSFYVPLHSAALCVLL